MKHPTPALKTALRKHQQGDFDDASRMYLLLLEATPDDSMLHRLLGTAYAQKGVHEKAKEHLAISLALDPYDADAHNNLAIVLKETGDLAAAIDHLERALHLRPDYVDALTNLGDALRIKGRLQEAEAVLRQGLKLAPGKQDLLNNLGIVLEARGQLPAAEQVFREILTHSPQHAIALFNLANILKKNHQYIEAEALYRQAFSQAPNNTAACNNLAVMLIDSRRASDALPLLQHAISLQPDNDDALANMGTALRQLQRNDDAVQYFQQALAINPHSEAALCGLGTICYDAEDVKQGLEYVQRALSLNPNYVSAITNLGYGYSKLNRNSESIACYRHALELEPHNLHARFHLGYELLLAGRYAEGWRHYEARLHVGNAPIVPGAWPLWQGESLAGKSILVRSEQGFGDSLQFLRFIPLLMQQEVRVIFEVQRALLPLLETNACGDELLPQIPDQAPVVEADYQIPLLSLPGFFGVTLETISGVNPYLQAAPEKVAYWRERMANDDKFRIGLAWAGNPTHTNDRNRSMNLHDFSDLGAYPETSLYSLQKGQAVTQTKEVHELFELKDFTAQLASFADTAALIANLDLVICVDTSIAHLAGALGKQVWLLLPYAPDWRWGLDRNDTPWYASVRLFRQPAPGDWRSVMQQVMEALPELIAGVSEASAVNACPEESCPLDLILCDSAFYGKDGKPLFRMPIPEQLLSDPGVRFLYEHESRCGGFEYPTRKFLLEHLEAEDVFIDVGAHWGIYALTAACADPEIQVVAIEPAPGNIPYLTGWVEFNNCSDRIHIMPIAAGDAMSEMALLRNSSMGNRLCRDGDGAETERTRVSVLTLDHIMEHATELAACRIFLKIDVEGFEPEVIHGARQMLDSGQVAVIIWEKGQQYDEAAGRERLRDTLNELTARGYQHWRFPHENMGGALVPFVANEERVNIFSVHRDFNRRNYYHKPGRVHAPPVPRANVTITESDRLAFIHRLIVERGSDAGRWSDRTQLLDGAKVRAGITAGLISAGPDVLDIGSGAMLLQAMLPDDFHYQAFDLVGFAPETQLGDLNQGQYPQGRYACIVCVDLLQYIHDPAALLNHLAVKVSEPGTQLIIAYPTCTDEPQETRRLHGWFNDFTNQSLVELLEASHWKITHNELLDALTWITAIPADGAQAEVAPLPGISTEIKETDEVARRKRVIDRRETDFQRWNNPKQLKSAWNARAQRAADFIPAGATVMDFGCGAMALQHYLPHGCHYIPCDVARRDSRTVLCDFNNGEYPDAASADLISQLGVLEYLYDVDAHLQRLRQYNLPVVISYCPSDITAHLDRAALGWVNHLSQEQLTGAINNAGFTIRNCERIDEIQLLFKLDPALQVAVKTSRVLVLSYNNVGNFGDRLGYHLINEVVPAGASVYHAHFNPWDVPVEQEYDMVVLGIGNSLFKPMLTPQLLTLLDRSPRNIGIFGSQYRQEIDSALYGAVVDKLDIWFARYEEDALLYGKGRNNVVHFGDWLISAFPMARAEEDSVLNIGSEIWNDLPLDRTIQRIQRYRKVFSTRLHPLLGALTSADQVAYREQYESSVNHGTGKFRSMLLDVFGRTWPEEKYFDVDRDAVMRYKLRIQMMMHELRDVMARLLGDK